MRVSSDVAALEIAAVSEDLLARVPARRQHDVVKPRGHRTGRHPQAPRATVEDRRDLAERHHVARPLGLRRRALGRAGGGLARERPIAFAQLHPAREGPRDARARQRRERWIEPLGEDDHVEPTGAAAQRVRPAFGPVHDAVLGVHRICLAVLPQQPLTAEHEEDLLVAPVLVSGRGEVVLGDLDPAQAHRPRARLPAEVPPHRLDVPDRELSRRAVVQVGDLHRPRP